MLSLCFYANFLLNSNNNTNFVHKYKKTRRIGYDKPQDFGETPIP